MPREVTVLHYKFEELSEKAQKRAIEKMQETIHSDFHYEAESITEMFNYTLKERGLPHGPFPGESRGKSRRDRDEEGTVEWSLSCCQGDGVAFYGPVDLRTCARRLLPEKAGLYCRAFHVLEQYGLEPSAKITRNSFGNHYSHRNTMTLEHDAPWENYDEYKQDVTEHLEEVTIAEDVFFAVHEELIEAIREDIRTVSSELESKGYDAIEDYTSEEAAKDMIIANEYEFDEQGDMV